MERTDFRLVSNAGKPSEPHLSLLFLSRHGIGSIEIRFIGRRRVIDDSEALKRQSVIRTETVNSTIGVAMDPFTKPEPKWRRYVVASLRIFCTENAWTSIQVRFWCHS